jgi:phospholipid-translocating ATPase
MGKEAYDDYSRYLRDREANSTRYLVLVQEPFSSLLPDSHVDDPSKPSLPRPQTRSTPSAQIKVGDMVLLEKNQRVPADMVLLTTSEEEGTCFIRTDQLDGETDWKLKVAVGETQKMGEKGVAAAEGNLYGKLSFLEPVAVADGSSRSADKGYPHVLRRPQPDFHVSRTTRDDFRPAQRRERPLGEHGSGGRECRRICRVHWQGDKGGVEHE